MRSDTYYKVVPGGTLFDRTVDIARNLVFTFQRDTLASMTSAKPALCLSSLRRVTKGGALSICTGR